LHTNGYSLARKVLLDKFSVNDKTDDLELSVGEELLRIHKSYLKLITELKENIEVKGLSHITGGGIVGNTKRILPEGYTLKINWNAWDMPPIFKLIQKTGNIIDTEMREVFNLGIGLISVVSSNDVNRAVEIAKSAGEDTIILGEVTR
jgi:phosphoribosylformylglycinamidine cyclo-ligase